VQRSVAMATSVLIPTAAHRGARSARLALPAATVLPDADRRFEVRLGDAAAAQIRAGIASARRRLGPDPETGGVLFGERDDAAGVIWIDEATGPPRDSVESSGLPTASVRVPRSSPAPPGLSSDRFPRSGGRMMPQPSDEPPERRLVHAGR
jgi:hypothetical protein